MPIGKAVAYGAVTVVNALATGKGSALSVSLWTEATVKLTDKPGVVDGVIVSDPQEDKMLMEKCVLKVLKRFNVDCVYGAYVETRSNIPIARGLKSSSVASNAIVLAVLNALNEELPDEEVLRLGIEASIEAGVTVTGALDDASASYLGGVTVTDNKAMKVLKRFEIDDDVKVLIYVPKFKRYTTKMDLSRLKLMAEELDVAFREAIEGRWRTAMVLNGLICCSALGYSLEPVLNALETGALASGLSGKGPAIVALARQNSINSIKKTWRTLDGELIETSVNNRKAQMLR
ncbi:shikimate kinase [Candidatus Bathyarchaeota archaeon]|nr:shikimate kinase [Candidatus Bathyarchaeota archaeon]MBS7618823.1 shikimate kinase [Candidatus Bathyarchaeota archaeon]